VGVGGAGSNLWNQSENGREKTQSTKNLKVLPLFGGNSENFESLTLFWENFEKILMPILKMSKIKGKIACEILEKNQSNLEKKANLEKKPIYETNLEKKPIYETNLKIKKN